MFNDERAAFRCIMMNVGLYRTGFWAKIKRHTSHIIYYISYIISFASFAQSSYHITPELQKAHQEIIKLKTNSGIQKLAKNQPNAFQIYAQNYEDIVALLVSDDERLFKKYASQEDIRLEILESLPQNSAYYRFYQAEIRLHWAFVKLKFGKEVSGSWDIIKAYKLLEENAKLFPDFLPTYKSLGLLHVLIGSTPQNYRWVAKLLGLNGNIQQGLKEIRRSIETESLFRTEAQLIDILVHAYILKYSEKENKALLNLVADNTDNLLLHFFGTSVSMKDGRSEQALRFLNTKPIGNGYLSFPFLDYLKAEINIQKGEYQTAKSLYNSFLAKYQGVNFVKDTHYKLFLCYWFLNNDVEAKTQLLKLQKVGKTVVEADKAAQKFTDKYLRNDISSQQKTLVKARLAFDGGYLDEALTLFINLNEISFLSIYDKAEYQYRLGRIQQKRNNFEASIRCYDRALQLSRNNGYYFGATSALQLGYIFRQLNQKQKAVVYFKTALDYPTHEYKNSIDNKAKAALTEIGVAY